MTLENLFYKLFILSSLSNMQNNAVHIVYKPVAVIAYL